jgi:hypothetical protein
VPSFVRASKLLSLSPHSKRALRFRCHETNRCMLLLLSTSPVWRPPRLTATCVLLNSANMIMAPDSSSTYMLYLLATDRFPVGLLTRRLWNPLTSTAGSPNIWATNSCRFPSISQPSACRRDLSVLMTVVSTPACGYAHHMCLEPSA